MPEQLPTQLSSMFRGGVDEDLVSLVAFHPRFARWHALDPSVTEGTQVTSHYEAGRCSWVGRGFVGYIRAA